MEYVMQFIGTQKQIISMSETMIKISNYHIDMYGYKLSIHTNYQIVWIGNVSKVTCKLF